MGRATRWLKGILGMKRDKENKINLNEIEAKEKKRWSFAKSGRDSSSSSVRTPLNQIPVNVVEREEERRRQAMEVAEATAKAAADAAVAAAQAAVVAVVRMRRQEIMGGLRLGCGGERWIAAAVKIQAVFRGYLARKALRALKGLVKLQAHVRGYLVRKQAAETLHSMQALHRAQATVRSQRASRSLTKNGRPYSEYRHRKSIEKFDETRTEFPSKRLSASYEHSPYNIPFHESSKIIEIDTVSTKSRSRRTNLPSIADYGEDFLYQTISSPLPCLVPARLSIPERRSHRDHEWTLYYGDEPRTFTAHCTPRFMNSLSMNGPPTPTKSLCGDAYCGRYDGCDMPNYMANTQSFRAKLRSQSAPRQRPEAVSPRKRISLQEIMAARDRISSIKMQGTCSNVQEPLNF